jgi:membrane-associated phospholipid phosphatase
LAPFERIAAIMIKPGVMVSYVVVIVLSILYIDRPLAYYFHGFDFRTTQPLLMWFTHLGISALYIGGLFLLALFFRYIRRDKLNEKRAWFLWLCVLIPSLVCIVLKVLLGRARPELLFTEQLYGFFGLQREELFWSFPSGHTTTIMGFVFGLSVLFPRYCYAFIAVGLMVVLSRIMLTYHYLSDVMAAAYLSLLQVTILKRKSKLFGTTTG